MKLTHHNRYNYSAIVDRPNFSWPDGKRLAFYIALNVEHFSFDGTIGHTPTSLTAPPDPRNFAWRDYGLRVGIWRIFDLIEEFQLPLCHLLNASVCDYAPAIIERIRQRDDEVIGHGFTNSERQSDMDEKTETAMIADATRILEKNLGKRPLGWMGPWISETIHTPDLLKEAGYEFVMDWPADDQPFWMKTRSGPILSIPYPIEINDSPTMLSRAQPAGDFYEMVVDQFDEMLRLSNSHSLVCGLALHTFVCGQPFRLRQLRRVLEHIVKHPQRDKVWFTKPGAIAQYAANQGSAVAAP